MTREEAKQILATEEHHKDPNKCRRCAALNAFAAEAELGCTQFEGEEE